MMKRIWLITGGCGFIGKSLAAYLLEKQRRGGIDVRVLDNLSVGSEKDLFSMLHHAGRPEFRTGGVELFRGDIRNFEDCFHSVRGVETVVHLAANTGVEQSVRNPLADMEANVAGTLNMLEAARRARVRKFIFASSGAPLGEVQPPIHEGVAPRPVSPYGASKLAGEGYCMAYTRTFGLPAMALRFGNVYGPGSGHKGSVVASFFRNALNGLPIEISGDGSQTRDFIYIEDIVRAMVLAAKAQCEGEVFQIATCRETSVNELAAAVRRILEERTGIRTAVSFGSARPGDVKRNYSDITKARRMLGFEPLTTLDEGLQKTLEYFLREAGVTQRKDRAV